MTASVSAPSIAKLIGEGYARPQAERELPIDINYQRVLEWMVTRQKLPNDWHKRLQAIQAKVVESAKQLPPSLLASLPGSPDAPIDFFRAVQIRDKLAETGDRTLFGGLSGQAGTWDRIVKAYEQGGVYLGEAAQTMVQAVDFEVPYLRKQQAKHSQAIADGERKHGEYLKAAATATANYQQECRRLGVAGANVTQELRQLGNQLPALFREVIAQLQQPAISDAMDHYAAFTAYAHGGEGEAESSAGADAELLPNLAEVREGRTAPPPPAAAAAGVDPPTSRASVQIHWDFGAETGAAGDADGAAAADEAIDWDLGDWQPPAASANAAEAINWDLGVAEQQQEAPTATREYTAGSEAAAAVAPLEVSWDIELTDAAASRDAPDAGASAAGALEEASGGDAPGQGTPGVLTGSAAAVAARLQSDTEYRARLMEDVQELRAFLAQRKQDLQGGGSDLLHVLLPDAIQSVDATKAGTMLAAVDAAIELLEAPKLRQLLLLASSPRYLERTSRELQRKAGQEAKMLAAAQETVARRHEARAALAALGPKVAEQVARVRVIKTAIEGALTAMLGGRRVNVLGEVNNVLASAGVGA